MLWIGLHFPRLPLETLLRGSPSPEAWAVIEQDRILLADRKALARGVRPGMLLSAALAMAPQLQTRRRDAAAETENLLGLAAWASQFTPSVALEFPDGLVIEVSGSLKLFGGLENLIDRVKTGLADMGFGATLAVAPSAKAASWLAREAHGRFVKNSQELKEALQSLPIHLLHGRQDIQEGWAAIGVSTLGELLALPREGVARRFGQEVLDEVDRALGRLADPRSFFSVPARFHAAIELPAEIAQAEALAFAGRRLLAQLAGFLAARSAGVQRFVFRLFHREGPSTDLDVGLVAPSRDAGHFTLLLRERLVSLVLREAVRSIVLEAGNVLPFAGTARSLIPEDRTAPGDWPRLIERLRARLGNEAVHSVAVAPEHRPELAQRSVEPGTGQLQLDFGERPFWLLGAPRPIKEVASVPHYQGPLTLLAGPERIESGWWDGEDVARDYFVARTPDDALVWVYRERGQAEGWFLHGVFS